MFGSIKGSSAGGINGKNSLSLNQGFEFFSHCIQDPVNVGDVNESNGTVNVTDPRTGTADEHPGQWRFRLENSPNGRAVFQQASAAATRPFTLGGGSWIFEVLVNFETLATAGDEYVAMWGLADARADDVISDGVYFEYGRVNSVNFIGVTEASGTRTEQDSSIAVSTDAGTWTTLRFEINASGDSVEFFVNGTSIGTSTTNIPSGDLQYFVRSLKSASTGAQNTFYMDYIYLRNELTTEV